MSQQLDDEGKLVSMIMEANKDYRYAGICDVVGNILWSSKRDNVGKLLSLDETKSWLKRAIASWKDREQFTAKIGKGQFSYTGYEKLKHITVPLKNGHMLFISLGGKDFPYLGDIMKIVKYVEEHPSQQ
jgi:hypothetical protein